MAIPTVFKANRMRYDMAKDTWFLTTDFPLPDHAVKSAARWARKLQIDRLRSAVGPTKRDAIKASIAALAAHRIKQELVNGQTKTSKGDLTLIEGKR